MMVQYNTNVLIICRFPCCLRPLHSARHSIKRTEFTIAYQHCMLGSERQCQPEIDRTLVHVLVDMARGRVVLIFGACLAFHRISHVLTQCHALYIVFGQKDAFMHRQLQANVTKNGKMWVRFSPMWSIPQKRDSKEALLLYLLHECYNSPFWQLNSQRHRLRGLQYITVTVYVTKCSHNATTLAILTAFCNLTCAAIRSIYIS